MAAGQYLTDDIYLEFITDARGFTQLEISLTPALSVLSQAGLGHVRCESAVQEGLLMRRLAMIAFLVLGACNDEPDFDQHYSQAADDIRAQAEQLDEELEAANGSQDTNSVEAPSPSGAVAQDR